MKYIIMCGGTYVNWPSPRWLTEINGETLVGRTIKLLRENGVQDISISGHEPALERLGVPILKHYDEFTVRGMNDQDGFWCNCFYPTDEPTCYIFGDVYYSPAAIKTIVEYEGPDIMLFGSKKPFAPEYPKPYVEPFAFKVWDTEHLKRACDEVRRRDGLRLYKRRAMAWETWATIKGLPPRKYDRTYVAINDYTCDIDTPEDIKKVGK